MRRHLLLICLGALALRLIVLPFITHPGLADPNHYYNMGVRLKAGAGYTIDYIWQYNDVYLSVVHEDDYWMPLSAGLVWAAVSIFGESARAAVIPFLLIGSLLPLIGYWAARQLDLSHGISLIAAGFAAVVPELVMNSARTDTTVPNALLVCLSILLMNRAFRREDTLSFVLSGATVGLAYLNRSENLLLLPMLTMLLIIYRGRCWHKALLVPLTAALIAAPWIARTIALSGSWSTSTTSNMFFLSDYRDHYLFDVHLNWQTYVATVTPAQMIGKRLFEMAAGIKMMITTLDVVLPVLIIGGGLLLLRDRPRWRALAPTVILLLGIFVFYTIFAPYKAQGGSLKKAYLTLVPLLIPVGVYALERVITNRRYLVSTAIISIALMGMNGFELVRADQAMARSYTLSIEAMRDVARTLPDGGDGLVLMTQDPFILSYVGISSIVFPQNDRDTLIAVAQRYSVDYLLMPADRPNLDGIMQGDDPRFVPVANVPGTQYVFYRIEAP